MSFRTKLVYTKYQKNIAFGYMILMGLRYMFTGYVPQKWFTGYLFIAGCFIVAEIVTQRNIKKRIILLEELDYKPKEIYKDLEKNYYN